MELNDKSIWNYERSNDSSKHLDSNFYWGKLIPTSSKEIKETVYFLHGGDSDDQMFTQASLEKTFDKLVPLFQDRGIQLVFPSIDLSFLKKSEPKSYYRYFFEEVIPISESGTETSNKTRWITGVSMGGAAALNAFFSEPEKFAGVGVHFPGVIDFNPFDSSATQNYQKKTGISDENLKTLLWCFHTAFKDEKDFYENDPLALLAKLDRNQLERKKIYLDCGTKDPFGLFHGTKQVSELLFQKDIPHSLRLIENGLHDLDYVKNQFSNLLLHLLN